MRWGGGFHWSYGARAWCGFFQHEPSGRVILRHELTWRKTTPEIAAAELVAAMTRWKIRDELSYIAANATLWPADKKGETIAETFLRAGVPLQPASTDRVHCWSRLRSWLEPRVWPDKQRLPMLRVHASCTRFIQTVPILVASKRNPDDVEQTPDEYPAAGASYYAMSRPMPTPHDEPDLPEGAVGHWVRELREAAMASRG